jgi:hypothetical protein
MHWKLEALFQNIIAPLPFSHDIYYFGQRVAGSFRTFDISGKVRQSSMLLDTIESAGLSISGLVTVEIGSGWIPIAPLFMWLHGQATCHSFDVVNLLRPALLRRTVEQLLSRQEEFTNFLLRADPLRWSQLPLLAEADDIIGQLATLCDIHLDAPVDTGAVPLPDNSADIVYSNTVLEHVPANEIPRVFREAHRLLRPGGYMVHQIDLSDHFSHSDSSISPLNFLRYSEKQFARFNNSILYQNRWRSEQYREAIEASSFTIVYWTTLTSPRAQAAVKTLPLDRTFKTYADHELAVTGIQVAAQKLWR